MVAKLDYGIRGNFNPFLPANGLVLDGTNVSGSNLFSLSIGGSNQFNIGVNKGNNQTYAVIGPGSSSGVRIQNYDAGGSGRLVIASYDGSTYASIISGGLFSQGSIGLTTGISTALYWGSSIGVADTSIYRDAAGILAQRNSTSAQAFRLYNTYTDASNYERAVFDWQTTTNVLTIGVQYAGTGSQRSLTLTSYNATLDFAVNGSTRVNITNLTITPQVDGAITLGASKTARRFGTAWFAGTVQPGQYTVATLPSATVSGAGAIAFVTDASSGGLGAPITGSGNISSPVWTDGTNWYAGLNTATATLINLNPLLLMGS